MHKELKREEIRVKLKQRLIIDHARYDDKYFIGQMEIADPDQIQVDFTDHQSN